MLATTSTAEATLLAMEHKEISLLVVMPEMNGRSLAEKLLSIKNDFTQKPFSIHSVSAKVREMLDRI